MKVNIVLLNESGMWSPEIRNRAGELFGVYLYDPAKEVHCAELTGSYELEFVGTVAKDSDEALENELLDGDAKCESPAYFHCNTIDSLPTLTPGTLGKGKCPLTHKDGDEFDSMEEAMEYYRGNPRF